MKITVEFNSLEEMDTFCNSVAVGSGAIIKEAPKKKKEAPVKAEEPVKEEAPAEEVPFAEDKQEEAPKYTLEDVRAALGALQKAGKRDEVKALLQSFGAAKLPEVSESDYPALMEKVGELNA